MGRIEKSFVNGKFFENELELIAEILRGSKSVFVASHESPEADAIGSSLALGLALENMGKRVWIYNKDELGMMKYLPCSEKVKRTLPDFTPDTACILDSSTIKRIGEEAQKFVSQKSKEGMKVLNIDHHSSCEKFGDVAFIDPTASATGVIVYELLEILGAKITPEIATNLYAALAKDTLFFLLPTVDSRTMNIAAKLVECGADTYRVMKALRFYPFRKMKLLGRLIQNLKVEDGVAVSFLTQKDFQECGAFETDSDDFADTIRTIEGVLACAFLRELQDGSVKVSLRSEGDIDVGKIALKFGGGGHKNAAGFISDGKIEDVMENIVQILKRMVAEKKESGKYEKQEIQK